MIPTFILCASTLFADVTIIGHRGSPCSAPENTLSSFQHAIDIGADFIEFDIHLTKDGVPIVSHDALLGKHVMMSRPCGVNCLTLKELKYYDAGVWFSREFEGETIPTLEEVFDLAHGKIGMMIEIKTGTASEKKLAEEVMKVVQSRGRNHKPVVIGSFSPIILENIRKIDPNQSIIAIAETVDMIERHLENDPEYLGLIYTIVTPEFVHAMHEKGRKIWTWTVNDEDEMTRLVTMGVDGLISNRPMAMKQCKEMTAAKSPL